MRRALALLSLVAAPVAARDALGMFDHWAAFRDPGVPRCYAIAAPARSSSGGGAGYADIGIWPRRGLRDAVHLRLSRRIAPGEPVVLAIGGQRFRLAAGIADAWAADTRMDAALVAAMRSAAAMSASASDPAGHRFTDAYDLAGAATAMDAAALACAPAR